MKRRSIILSGIVLSVLAFTAGISAAQDNQTEIIDDIEFYEGSVGPESVLYGLKIGFEDLDETFTFNTSEKVRKQVSHARQRLAEAKTELRKKNFEAADRALERYREKIKASDDLVSGFAGNDSGLLHAQRTVVKHRFVLEQLLESHPNNTGLERAYNNSIEIEEKFELRTKTRLERIETKDRQRIKIREVEREKIEVKAKIIDNTTEVKVEVKFASNSTEPKDIAQEILNKLNLSKQNISSLLEIEVEDEERLRREELEAKAEVERGVTEVKAEFRFPLNTTNRTDIIERIHQKLSALTKDDIMNALEFKVKERREDRQDDRRRDGQDDRRGDRQEDRRGNKGGDDRNGRDGSGSGSGGDRRRE